MARKRRKKNIAPVALVSMLILTGVYMLYAKKQNPQIVPEETKTDKIARDSRTQGEKKTNQKFEPDSKIRIRNKVEQTNLTFPPSRLLMYADKSLRTLQVYGYGRESKPELITTYDFAGFSGKLGPKLREGDRQIPEGIYDITALNPQSRFHLSIRVEYPNAFDKRIGANENRTNLGGDIYIHGGSATIGCIPIGNDNIEELFYLVEQTGLKNTDIVITPHDLTAIDIDKQQYPLPWQNQLYKNIKQFTNENLPKK